MPHSKNDSEADSSSDEAVICLRTPRADEQCGVDKTNVGFRLTDREL